VLRFVALFALFLAAFYALTATSWFTDQLFGSYLELNAQVSAAILRLLGQDARAVGSDLISPRFVMAIERGCDAVEPSFLFIAALLAFPASVRAKAAGILGGVTLLLALNLVRIISLHYTGVYLPSAFETVHIDVWQTLFVAFALLLWIMWAWAATNSKKTAGRASNAKKVQANVHR
jgi:exosortase H (IPTLxxWG-CTERM-specific)